MDLFDDVIHSNKQIDNKTIIDILNFAFDKYLIGQSINIQDLIVLFLKRFLSRFRSDININYWMEFEYNKYHDINLDLNGSNVATINISTINLGTLAQLKDAISSLIGIPTKELMLLDARTQSKLNDKDSCEGIRFENLIITIICNSDNISILMEIGSGSFGSISLCINKLDNKPFALKKPKSKGNLLKEISVYQKNNKYDDLVRYDGIYCVNDKVCLAMEYFPKGTLSKYIKERKYLQEPEIARISHQLLIQIKQIHEMGIAHRDIKSDNIVFDEHFNAKLIDFGMSKTIYQMINSTNEERDQSSTGTIYYASPEFLNSEKYDEKVDIWSFGAVVIEMTTGDKPFHTLSPIQISKKMAHDKSIPFSLPKPISEELTHFIKDCTMPNNYDRPSASQLIQSKFINKYS